VLINDLDVSGVTVRYVDEGPASSPSPPLLLLHGYLGSSLDWYDVLPLLASHRRVIAIDHRGHGDGAKFGLASAYTFDALLDDLVGFVDAVALDQFHLAGHSMGGVIAMRYALVAPERLASLVLVDTAAAPAGRLPREILDGLIATGRTAGMDAVAELILSSLAGVSDVRRERGRRKFGAVDVEAMAALADELESYPDLLPQLADLTVPTTVICGANDDLLTACRRLADVIPGAELEVVPGAGHSPFEDEPEHWVRIVESHLDRADTRLAR